MIELYTDGACEPNPGIGGWAYIIKDGRRVEESSGGELESTNNRMEITGVLQGLKRLRFDDSITVYTDSKYVVDSINKGWLDNWIRFKQESRLNYDLWTQLHFFLIRFKDIKFVWVKGHHTNEYNNRCDEMAVEARIRIKKAHR